MVEKNKKRKPAREWGINIGLQNQTSIDPLHHDRTLNGS